jgi:hypothetical protein
MLTVACRLARALSLSHNPLQCITSHRRPTRLSGAQSIENNTVLKTYSCTVKRQYRVLPLTARVDDRHGFLAMEGVLVMDV